MNTLKKWAPWIAVIIIIIFVASGCIGLLNEDARYRNMFVAKEKDNQNQFDLMIKTISGVAQVAQKDRDSLKEIIIGYAEARTGNSDNLVMKWANEAMPNISSANMKIVMDQIISTRNAFATRQKELIDIKRQHDNLLDTFPGGFFLSAICGKKKVDITIVTSSRTQEVFKTGQDNDDQVFK